VVKVLTGDSDDPAATAAAEAATLDVWTGRSLAGQLRGVLLAVIWCTLRCFGTVAAGVDSSLEGLARRAPRRIL
jgi:hypothetical protein